MTDKANSLDAFENKLKNVIQTESIDQSTAKRLDRARALAIEAIPQEDLPSSQWRFRPYAMAATVAATGVIAYALLSGLTEEVIPVATVDSDMELLLAEDDLDMLAEVEFFQWMSVVSDEG